MTGKTGHVVVSELLKAGFPSPPWCAGWYSMAAKRYIGRRLSPRYRGFSLTNS
jgi:hypothetical protein